MDLKSGVNFVHYIRDRYNQVQCNSIHITVNSKNQFFLHAHAYKYSKRLRVPIDFAQPYGASANGTMETLQYRTNPNRNLLQDF